MGAKTLFQLLDGIQRWWNRTIIVHDNTKLLLFYSFEGVLLFPFRVLVTFIKQLCGWLAYYHKTRRYFSMPDVLDMRPDPNNASGSVEEGHYEMDDSNTEALPQSGLRSAASTTMPVGKSEVERGPVKGIAKHTLGLLLLLCVVFLWTLSNFLGSVGHFPYAMLASRFYGCFD